jgi:DNA excision repair protein ERCC-2
MVPVESSSAEGAEIWLAHDEARPGQSEMIEHIVRALANGGHHLAAAPTGIGKTAAALAGCIAEIRGNGSAIETPTIMFLTGRQSQHRIVVETAKSINARLPEGKRRITLVDMIGQSHMCVQPFAKEHPALFSRLCNDMRSKRSCRPWLEKAPSLSDRILSNPLHVDELVEVARHHRENGRSCQVCPWRAARDSAARADIVVCDYNHLFDDNVRDATLSAMGLNLENLILVIDEAHNLPDRIRRGMERRMTSEMVRNATFEMEEYASDSLEDTFENLDDSPSWALEVLKALRQEVVSLFKSLSKRLAEKRAEPRKSKNDKQVDEIRIEAQEIMQVVSDSIEKVNRSGVQTKLDSKVRKNSVIERDITHLISTLSKVTIEVDETDDEEERELACSRLAAILEILNQWAEDAALVVRFDAKTQNAAISTHLLDAGLVSGPVLSKVRGSVLMSGTLHPPSMYADLLSVPKNAMTSHSYPSPFLAQNRPVAIAEDVTTKWDGRGKGNTERIRKHIEAVIAQSNGHVAVFAPSYIQLREYVGEHRWRTSRVIQEDSNWNKSKADKLLQELEDERSRGRKVLLAGVYGGRLSEGIDYHDNLLSAVVCIGIPMAPPSIVSDALREYISDRFGKGKGWHYASFQPAVNAVMQAMGRPIRAYGDKAFVLLLDKRLKIPNYKRCLPDDMEPISCADAEMTDFYAARFFRSR